MHHLQNPFFELIRHDVVEPMLIEVDQVYHLACPASPVHYKHNPVKTIKTSVMGTLNMLGLAKRVGARPSTLPEVDAFECPRCGARRAYVANATHGGSVDRAHILARCLECGRGWAP